jgi:hypothetical protein
MYAQELVQGSGHATPPTWALAHCDVSVPECQPQQHESSVSKLTNVGAVMKCIIAAPTACMMRYDCQYMSIPHHS